MEHHPNHATNLTATPNRHTRPAHPSATSQTRSPRVPAFSGCTAPQMTTKAPATPSRRKRDIQETSAAITKTASQADAIQTGPVQESCQECLALQQWNALKALTALQENAQHSKLQGRPVQIGQSA